MWGWAMLVAVGTAADEGFSELRTTHDCVLAARPSDHAAGSAMRATCEWPDVEPGVLGRLMSDLDRYEELVFALVESEVRERRDDRLLVYQRQSVFGISDREVLLWVDVVEGPGVTVVSWRQADGEPLALRSGAIRTPRNEGFWRVEPLEDGGSRVVHQIGVDAGGRIPAWIVRLVRSRGFARVMKQVRSVAADASSVGKEAR